jgi:hypothetical protein
MNPIKIIKTVLAELKTWLTVTRATIATHRTLFVARLGARWAAIKGWFARKKKAIFWRVVLLVTAVVAMVLLVYLYRRSLTVRAALDSLLGDATGSLRKAMPSLRNWVTRKAPQPVKAIPAPWPDDEPAVVVDKAEPIPAMPSQDGPLPEEMKL